MSILKNRRLYATIAVLMVLSFAVSMLGSPTAFAQSKNTTYPFVDAIPNPVGVNQRTLINFGLLNYLNVDGDGWNVTLTITKPDNTTEKVGPLMTWSTGTVGHYFTPDTVGTYYLECSFDEVEYRNVTYAASKTEKLALIVQEDPVPVYPGHALPSEYWTRPIDSQLREWFSLAGSWVAIPQNLIAPYNDGPESAHILWTRPIGDTMGGLAGGDTGQAGYQHGDAYEGKWSGSVIIGGILYYNKYMTGFTFNSPQQEIVAVDLHTGETVWSKNIPVGNGRISTGQVLMWDSLNNRGAFSYIWVVSGSNWYALDALTGDLKYNMTNVPGGTNYRGPNGEILKYQIVNQGNSSNPDYRLLRWNSSYVVNKGKVGMAESWGSQVQGVSFNAAERGYDLNVSIPFYNQATTSLPGNRTIQMAFVDDRVILASVTATKVQMWALSLAKGHEGALLFNTQWTPPAEWEEGNITLTSIGQAGWCAWSQADMVGVYFTKENLKHYAFSLEDGSFLWETEPQIYADAWSDTVLATFGPDRIIAYNTLYSATVGGIVYAYNITTGDLKWTYNATDPFHESYISNNWWIMPLFVTDGKIYFGHLEHSALEPKPRGAPFFALDAETGDLVFRADGLFRQSRWGGRAIIGDSIIATQDTYDQRVYAIGKGPSSMTVTAPDVGVPANTPVLIKGTVMDVSPGTRDTAITLRFPNGVPAVSDESMGNWMKYVYKQFEQPMDTTGVTVKIDAINPDGEYVNLGTTTSDASGRFAFEYTPSTAGKYIIYATFEGSASYYGSVAQNEMTVMQAAEPTQTPPISMPPYEMYTIGMGVAIIIAIALAVVLLRKRP